MSRLTIEEAIEQFKDLEGFVMNETGALPNDKDMEAFEVLIEAVQELQHYKDLEEQGLLLELPCGIGDVVYHIESGEVFTGIVFRIDYLPYAGTCMLGAYDMDNCFLGVFGNSCFTTRQEAEAKLEEKKHDNTR